MRNLPYLMVVFLFVAVAPVMAQKKSAADDNTTGGFGVPASVTAQYPEPAVTPLEVRDELLWDRAYRFIPNGMDIYDSPGGNLISSMGDGYHFVTLGRGGVQGEWTNIGTNRWIPTSQVGASANVSEFAGVHLPAEGLPFTMAWVLRNVQPSVEPGVEPLEDTYFLERYTRVYLYQTVEMDGERWYQVGNDEWVHQFDVAKVVPAEKPAEITTDKWVGMDLYEQVLIAYEGDTAVFATLISSGLPQWSTREGIFNVYQRHQRVVMSGANGQPSFYYIEEVPWTMFYDNDIALHGAYWHDGFGYRQSHGCVNMTITDSRWLFNWSADILESGESEVDLGVYVYTSDEYR